METKNKIFFGIGTIIVLILGSYFVLAGETSSWYYQENASSYKYVNITVFDDISAAFDGNWNVADRIYSDNGDPNEQLSINYTIFSSIGAVWKIKYDVRPQGISYGYCLNSSNQYVSLFTDSTDDGVEQHNYTINSDCLSNSILQLKINYTCTAFGYMKLYEEAIWWEITEERVPGHFSLNGNNKLIMKNGHFKLT